MNLEFDTVYFKDGKDGVVQKSMAADIKWGKYLCTSHCQIEVDCKRYTVLWELAPADAATNLATDSGTTVPDSEDSGHDSNQDDAEHDAHEHTSTEPVESALARTHCLPFKVLGTCYSRESQNALKEAYEYLYKHN